MGLTGLTGRLADLAVRLLQHGLVGAHLRAEFLRITKP